MLVPRDRSSSLTFVLFFVLNDQSKYCGCGLTILYIQCTLQTTQLGASAGLYQPITPFNLMNALQRGAYNVSRQNGFSIEKLLVPYGQELSQPGQTSMNRM
ncbi:hypothetical protein P692DRAFT_20492945 [Suillus brevipes Sb2]|nr:hypothetical protein P692DRAFT_20492945 [Suillus brevipes Sb2]